MKVKQNQPGLFQSFWQAGFESACHINSKGLRLNMAALTQHDRHLEADYANLQRFNIKTIRESIPWPLLDSHGKYEFAPLVPMVEAASNAGIQVIWSLCHFGWPDDLDVLSDQFVRRFARYSKAIARFLRQNSEGVPFYIPINEISFLSWAAGEKGWFFPFGNDCGGVLKQQFVRATIAAINSIWEEDPRARIVFTDPLIYVVPTTDNPQRIEEAELATLAQFEALDMIGGFQCSELGGDPAYLDILGVNYYHANQWDLNKERLRWEDSPRDVRWKPLAELLEQVYFRYKRPLFLAETSHFGIGRAAWLKETACEVLEARRRGVPVEGICIYPILDRPDWDNLQHWHNSGLWDLQMNADGVLERVLEVSYANTLLELQQMTSNLEPCQIMASSADKRMHESPWFQRKFV